MEFFKKLVIKVKNQINLIIFIGSYTISGPRKNCVGTSDSNKEHGLSYEGRTY